MPTVLIVDDDPTLATLFVELLTQEGYQVNTLLDTSQRAVQGAVERLEPQCVVLDGRGLLDYGEGWDTAAWLHQRDPVVPTIMLTGHRESVLEAQAQVSPRSRTAGFAAVLGKPFELDELVAAVDQAVED
jgi:DNA-binding response OmpR family regulator